MEIQTLFKSDSGSEAATLQINSTEEMLSLLGTERFKDRKLKWLIATSHPTFTIPYLLKDDDGFPDFHRMITVYRLYRRVTTLFGNERDNWLWTEAIIRAACEKYGVSMQDVKRFQIVEGDYITWVWYFYYKPDIPNTVKDTGHMATYFAMVSNKYDRIFGNIAMPWHELDPDQLKELIDRLQNTFNEEKNNKDKSKD